MTNEILQILGIVSLMAEEQKLQFEECSIAFNEIYNKYPEEVSMLALAKFGLEKQSAL